MIVSSYAYICLHGTKPNPSWMLPVDEKQIAYENIVRERAYCEPRKPALSTSNPKLSPRLKKYLIFIAPFKTENQEKPQQELGKEGTVPSCQGIKKRLLKFCNALYEKVMSIEHCKVICEDCNKAS
ncbi:hypothetical protein TNCV_1485391 [Trichonephila clavipes]|nr:hypothetical protein TNCV_1485391 [Trichonephila clavipes]